MTRVLAAIDTSPSARTILQTARSVGELFDDAVLALHVSENGADAPRRFAHEAGVQLRETTGSPIEAIVAAAQDPDVAAVVLGARGMHGGPRPAGHAALELITRVSKPVVVVPPDGAVGAQIARVLIPLEGTEESSEAIADTMARANRRDLEIVVLHVDAPDEAPPFEDQPHHEIPAWEREFAARFVSIPHTRVDIIQRVGAAADRVVPVARDIEADLIALGWSQDLSPGRAGVVRETLAHSPIPVLLVPTA